MAYGNYVESFELNGVQIKTTVTYNPKEVDDHISLFLHPANDLKTKVIGFDTEWTLFSYYDSLSGVTRFHSKCATVHLCDGSSCLIIRLCRDFKPPTSLLNFLHLTNYTFVGVGIKDNLAKLEKHYGIGCRNAVELGPLAATLLKEPRLSFCGVDELAFEVNKLDLRNHRPC